MLELRKAEKNGTLKPEGLQLVALNKPSESLFDLIKDPMEFNDLVNDPGMKEQLIKMRNVHDKWMKDILDVGLIPEPILRKWEEENDQPIYSWIRTNENFYDELLVMSSSENEKILFEGLDHPNEAIRYWAGQGIYNLNKKIKTRTVNRLIQKLSDPMINVGISAARALLKHRHTNKSLIELLSKGLKARNEWTRLQTSLVLDDFKEPLKILEKEVQNHIETDKNKYVVRVLNHGLNLLNGTSKKVR